MIDIVRLNDLPSVDVVPLLLESRGQGFDFLDRLVNEYATGDNRFAETGEALFGLYAAGAMIGIGGLNRDLYLPQAAAGRVRHVYVLATWRRQGIGRQLVEQIIAEARLHHRLLTLRTMTQAGDRFYQSMGFKTEPRLDGATHHMVLDAGSASGLPDRGCISDSGQQRAGDAPVDVLA